MPRDCRIYDTMTASRILQKYRNWNLSLFYQYVTCFPFNGYAFTRFSEYFYWPDHIKIFLYSFWVLMICFYYILFYQRFCRVYYTLGKLSPQTSRHWVLIDIGNQVPQSNADLLCLDSQLNFPDTNTACETLSYSYSSLVWRLHSYNSFFF